MRTAFIIGLLLLASCTATHPTSCAQDNKICPDGSIVSRTGATCEFVCPAADNSFCDYGSPRRDYKGNSADVCARIKFACPDGSEMFSDHCGCGCTVAYQAPVLQNSKVTNT